MALSHNLLLISSYHHKAITFNPLSQVFEHTVIPKRKGKEKKKNGKREDAGAFTLMGSKTVIFSTEIH